MKYEVSGAKRDTGAEIKVTVEATDFHHAERQANELGIMVADVREVHEHAAAAASPVSPQPTTVAGRTTCPACGGSPLVRRKVYRMSGPVVVIGYILLIPSFLGILLNGLLLVAPVLGLTGDPVEVSNEANTTLLENADVSQSIINKVMNDQPLTQDERDSLTPQQSEAVLTVELSRAGARAGACCAIGILGGGAVIGMVLSFVGGLLGWLLVMKKRVLQCVRCQATVTAS